MNEKSIMRESNNFNIESRTYNGGIAAYLSLLDFDKNHFRCRACEILLENGQKVTILCDGRLNLFIVINNFLHFMTYVYNTHISSTGTQIGILWSNWPLALKNENRLRNEMIASLRKNKETDVMQDNAMELFLIPSIAVHKLIYAWLNDEGKGQQNHFESSVNKVIRKFQDGLDEGKGSAVLLRYIDARRTPTQREIDLLRELGKYYPVHCIFPISWRQNTMELLKKLCKDGTVQGTNKDILQLTLNSECRFLMAVIEEELAKNDAKTITDPLRDLISDILEKLESTLTDEDHLDSPDSAVPLPERPTDFFPNHPRIRERGIYLQDEKNAQAYNRRHSAKERCSFENFSYTEYLDNIELENYEHCKNEHSKSSKFSPGLFIVTCSHRKLIGISLMGCSEGPNTLFTILYERFTEKQLNNLHVIFDNACKTLPYCLAREPKLFSRVLMQVRTFSWL